MKLKNLIFRPSNNNRIMSTSYTITKNKDYNSSSGCSPSAGSSASSTKLPMSPHGSQVSSTLSTSARTTPSRIPQPESSSPRKSRIPSAPRYYTPNRNHCKSPSVGSPVSVASPKGIKGSQFRSSKFNFGIFQLPRLRRGRLRIGMQIIVRLPKPPFRH